jgi:hypothetical protein
MSQLNVDTIKKADGTGNLSVPAETGTVVTTASPSLGRRNLIINGGFDIWQRGTSFSAIGNNVFAPDRWYSTKVATGCTISRDTGTYSKYAMLITGDAANTAQSMTQRIEASTSFNMSLNDHTFSAKVYTSVDRTIAIQIRSATAEDDFSGNTLQQNTSVDLVTGWNTVNISVPSVSAYNLGVQLTLAFGTVGAGETVKVEQVQLEVGSVATPFEHRSYGEELALCQRYYEAGQTGNIYSNSGSSSGNYYIYWNWKVTKRASPTVTGTGYQISSYAGTPDRGNAYGTGPTYIRLDSIFADAEL